MLLFEKAGVGVGCIEMLCGYKNNTIEVGPASQRAG